GIRRRVSIRHHDATNPVRSERVYCERGADRRVNSARHAKHDITEPALVYVISQSDHAGSVIRRLFFGQALIRTLNTAPTLHVALPCGKHTGRLKLLHLERKRLVGIYRERRDINNKLVLPDKHIDIEHRKTSFDNLAKDDLLSPINLSALI